MQILLISCTQTIAVLYRHVLEDSYCLFCSISKQRFTCLMSRKTAEVTL
uniref:Uncharacterized protein n=1 Tax=Anguilla anguilla TaxID=7936 RepID=A0A0E9R730_ANGAN